MLHAGWKWEKVETGESPPICENADMNLFGFHLTYDPDIEKLVLTYWNESEDMSDTWLWDGYTWSYECTHDASGHPNKDFGANQMFYDEVSKVLMDVRWQGCGDGYRNCGTLCRKDENSCWDCFLSFTPTFSTTYDAFRKRAVMANGSLRLILEWDGQQLHETQLNNYFDAEALVAYDEFSKQVIIRDRGYRTFEYDGVNLEEYEGLNEILEEWGMAYNPHLEGVVLSLIHGNTYVYKDHKWKMVPTVIGDLYQEYSWVRFSQMVYFPPTDQFLLLTIPLYDNDGCLAFYELKEYDRTHSRPFDKPLLTIRRIH